MATDQLIESVRELSSKNLETLLDQREAEDQALRALWRAALARERRERRQEQRRTRKGVSAA
jgi:hypothetical protein